MAANAGSAPVPVRKLTDVGGEFPSWSADGSAVHWALGNVLFTYDLAEVEADEEAEEQTARGRALLRVRAMAVADSLKDMRAEADSPESDDEDVPEELTASIIRLAADSVQVEADSLMARADSIRGAAEKIAERAARLRDGDEDVLNDSTDSYEAVEEKIEVMLPRDIPRGTVVLRGGRISNTDDIGPNETAFYKEGGEIPADTPPGEYQLCLVIDPGQAVPESNEGNNSLCQQPTVSEEPTLTSTSAPDPDPVPPAAPPTAEGCSSARLSAWLCCRNCS